MIEKFARYAVDPRLGNIWLVIVAIGLMLYGASVVFRRRPKANLLADVAEGVSFVLLAIAGVIIFLTQSLNS